MRIRLFAALALLLHIAAFTCLADAAQAAGRFALVIGNGAYQKAPVLPNPTRDAGDVADALDRLGFTVTRATNLNGNDMRRALTAFGRAAVGADMAVVYYAGHGIEVGGENWLIPVDAELQRDIDTENEAVSLKAVTLQVSQTRELGLVILDACRSNPFNNSMKRLTTTRAVSRGFARVEPSRNVLVAYAAKDGTTASDGDGRNSPFTTALLKNLETPGLEVGFLFRRIRDEVMTATQSEQEPFVYGSLSGQSIYLKAANTPPAAASPVPQASDEMLWGFIKDSNLAANFEEFLKRYPASARARDARARLETLNPKQQAALPPQPAPAAIAPPAPTPQSRPAPAAALPTAAPAVGTPTTTTSSPSAPSSAPLVPLAPGVAAALRSMNDVRTQRREVQEGGQTVITEPGRIIIRDPRVGIYVRSNELDRLRVGALEVKSQTAGGETRNVVTRPDRSEIISVFSREGRLLRRIRRGADGREMIIIDSSYRDPRAVGGLFLDLPPPAIRIPYDRYIVDSGVAPPELIYETMLAPPVDRFRQRFSLDEIQHSPNVRGLMPSLDVDTINFDAGSWEIPPDQAAKLQVVADALNRAIDRNQREVFLIEGHTDAVGNDVDDLSLSDRRAESVATLLTQQFGVRPENLTSQGYGKQYLKEQTNGPSRINRRVTIRRITPLLNGEQAGAAQAPPR